MEDKWTIVDLTSEIERLTYETWKNDKYPLLLSELGTFLTNKKGDYRPAIAPLKLRQFIATQLSSKVVLITHPFQKQKIALIPTGEEFSFVPAEVEMLPSAEDRDKVKASIWAAFVKPLPVEAVRYVDIADSGLRFQDVHINAGPPVATARRVDKDLIIDGRGPDYDAREVAARIKRWAAGNGLPEERLYNREAHGVSGKNSFFDVFRGLSDSDLRRIEIPFDIIMKLADR